MGIVAAAGAGDREAGPVVRIDGSGVGAGGVAGRGGGFVAWGLRVRRGVFAFADGCGRGGGLTWCEVFDATGRDAGETGVEGKVLVGGGAGRKRRGGEGGGCVLVVAVAGYAVGAGAADDDVGGQGWAGAVGGVGGLGGADECVGCGVAVGGVGVSVERGGGRGG